jgi:hypothetical protein
MAGSLNKTLPLPQLVTSNSLCFKIKLLLSYAVLENDCSNGGKLPLIPNRSTKWGEHSAALPRSSRCIGCWLRPIANLDRGLVKGKFLPLLEIDPRSINLLQL